MNKMLPILKYYYLSDLITQVGLSLTLIGLNWFVLEATGSSLDVGILMILGILSGIAGSLISGIIADSFNRKFILINMNSIQAFLALIVLIIIIFTKQFQINHIYILATLNGFIFNIYMPTSRALFKEIAPKDNISKYYSILEISMQLSMCLAAFIAGTIYKKWGVAGILTTNIITLLVSNLLYLKIPSNYSLIELTSSEGFMQKFSQGIRYLSKNHIILVFGIIMCMPQSVTVSMSVVLPNYVINYLYSDSMTFGFLNMYCSIGGVFAGLIIAKFNIKSQNPRFIVKLFAGSITALLILAFNQTIWLAYITIMFFGIVQTSIKISLNSFIMQSVTNEYIGRVLSVIAVVSTILQTITIYFIGWAIDIYPKNSGYIYLAIIMIIPFLIFTYSFAKDSTILETRKK
ncbi:MAG: MFS transporter [Rickettsiaceae bacterium]|nr:MFS transporter [Rickettsiaceae bacterium]